jgi:hypothetical protein
MYRFRISISSTASHDENHYNKSTNEVTYYEIKDLEQQSLQIVRTLDATMLGLLNGMPRRRLVIRMIVILCMLHLALAVEVSIGADGSLEE